MKGAHVALYVLKPVGWDGRKMRPNRKLGFRLEHQMSFLLHGSVSQSPHSHGKTFPYFLVQSPKNNEHGRNLASCRPV